MTIDFSLPKHLPESRASHAVRRGGSSLSSPQLPAFAVLAGAVFALLLISCGSSSAGVIATKCGAPISSNVKTLVNDSVTVTSTTFVNVAGAALTVKVPTGQTRCVRVRFSAVASCDGAGATDHCFIRVMDDSSGFPIDPAVIFTDQSVPAANSFEWATRMAAGSHPLRIQANVATGMTFTMNAWTLTVEEAD